MEQSPSHDQAQQKIDTGSGKRFTSGHAIAILLALPLIYWLLLTALNTDNIRLPTWLTHRRYTSDQLPFSVLLPRGWEEDFEGESVIFASDVEDNFRHPSIVIWTYSHDQFAADYAGETLQEKLWGITSEIDKQVAEDLEEWRSGLVGGGVTRSWPPPIYRRVIEYPTTYVTDARDVQVFVESWSLTSPGTLGQPMAAAYFEQADSLFAIRLSCPQETVSACQRQILDIVKSVEFAQK